MPATLRGPPGGNLAPCRGALVVSRPGGPPGRLRAPLLTADGRHPSRGGETGRIGLAKSRKPRQPDKRLVLGGLFCWCSWSWT